MLAQMADRGPDSAGIAIYRDPAPAGTTKLSLSPTTRDEDWGGVRRASTVHASHAVVVPTATSPRRRGRAAERPGAQS